MCQEKGTYNQIGDFEDVADNDAMVIFSLRVGQCFEVENLASELRECFGEYGLQDVRRDLAQHAR